MQAAFIVLVATFLLGFAVLCVWLNWQRESRISYEEYLAPVLGKHQLRFLASRPVMFASRPRTRPFVEVFGMDLDRLRGQRVKARVVTFEDANGQRTKAVAWLEFDRTDLTAICWQPELPSADAGEASAKEP